METNGTNNSSIRMGMFQDKVVIITGASAGIGACTAVEYAKEGAKLVLGGRNEENLKKTALLCEEQGMATDDILLVLGDLTNEEACNEIVDKAIEKFGHLDILVNNAGSIIHETFEKSTIENFDFMFNTNMRSVFIVTKRALPYLKESKGTVLNVSSIQAIIPAVRSIAYGIAKAALNHFTKALAQELGPSGVTVNCIVPGAIDTDILMKPGALLEGHPEKRTEVYEKLAEEHALKRIGDVKEVASVILFLTSPAASFITGAEVPVDGGVIGKSAF